MESAGASATPNRETTDGEVLPLVNVDQVSVEDISTWDLDSALNASTQVSGVFEIPPILPNIDPEGQYAVRREFRPAAQFPPPATLPPAATPPTPADVPEPVALLIVLGDMKIPHERSEEEPPVPFLEGEDVDDEAESDEDQAGAGMVTAGNLATLGLADEGFEFRPGAQFPPPADIPEPVALLIVLGDMKIPHERSAEEPPVPFQDGEDVDDEAESDEDQAGGNSSPAQPPSKRARVVPRMVTAGNLATLGLADDGFAFVSTLDSHVPAGPAKK